MKDPHRPYSVSIKVQEWEASNIFTEVDDYNEKFYGYNEKKHIEHHVNLQLTFDELGVLKEALEKIRIKRISKEKAKKP